MIESNVFWFLAGVVLGALVWAAKPRLERVLPKRKHEDLFWDRR